MTNCTSTSWHTMLTYQINNRTNFLYFIANGKMSIPVKVFHPNQWLCTMQITSLHWQIKHVRTESAKVLTLTLDCSNFKQNLKTNLQYTVDIFFHRTKAMHREIHLPSFAATFGVAKNLQNLPPVHQNEPFPTWLKVLYWRHPCNVYPLFLQGGGGGGNLNCWCCLKNGLPTN